MTTSSTLHAGRDVVTVRTLAAPEQFAAQPITLAPLAAGAAGILSPSEFAARLAGSSELAAPHVSADITLGLYTDHNTGTPQPNGSLSPLVENRPAWVLIIHGIDVVNSGPPDKPHIVQHSDVVHVYDASSGTELMQWSSASPLVTCPWEAGQPASQCATG